MEVLKRVISRRRFLALTSGGVLATAATGTGLRNALASDPTETNIASDMASVDPSDSRLTNLLEHLAGLGYVERPEWLQVTESSEWGSRGDIPPGVAIFATTAMTNEQTNELAVLTHVVSSDSPHLADRPPEAIVFADSPSLPIRTWVGSSDGVVAVL